MPRRQGTETRRMAGQVLVRLPTGTATALSAAAASVGLSDAAWVRVLLVDALGAEAADAAPVSRRARSHAAPSELVQAIAGLREALGEATGALTKSAVFARLAGSQAETLALLDALALRYRVHALEIDEIKVALLALERGAQ
ncbi:hypothetical protein EAH89_25555 [Roseomonas nepalensis]|uniref:Uncharacterized protein n=1 Tax=Muricoccus nepalensis TaxID=1854500 RepID=A0A502F9B3_9PROT|nr:hypothetical protein [Roseomonas nepalensis]TPG45992.1 hypothetical protein EAH89_25555 [Roseomonas nepalensis]